MSDDESNFINTKVNIKAAADLVRRIVQQANKEGTLSKLTPRIVRQKVEAELELDPGTLDEKRYKAKLRDIIQEAVETTASSDDEHDGDKQEGSSKRAGDLSRSRNESDEQEVSARKDDVVNAEKKRKNATTKETKKTPEPVKLASESKTEKYQSDSEMSVLIDNSPPKKRQKRKSDNMPTEKKVKEKKPSKESSSSPTDEQIKKLKSLVVACGVRKVWSKELKDCETASQQITHLRRILGDLGMKGRFSVEQAKSIRQKRELAREIQDVRDFAKKHAGDDRVSRSKKTTENTDDNDDDSESEASDEEVPRRPKPSAHRSIMAFLGDQSDSD